MQTILGSGGAIGASLAKELKQYTDKIRLVSRKPERVNGTDELFPADLTQKADVNRAVAGSEIVYVTIGFKYDIKMWRNTWPAFIQNVIAACEANNAKLVFFDNVYMYDKQYIHHMIEDTPINPSSKKGQVRAQLVRMIMDEVKAGRLQALIARAADFYGPDIKNSVLLETVYKNLKNGKKAMLFAAADKKHSYTYTPDAAKATALLGNTPTAYNQVWHLPTAPLPPTGKEWVDLFAKKMNVPAKYSVLPAWQLALIGVFVPFMRELHEMLYQYDREYVLDSSKFEKQFNIKPTAYEAGVDAIVNSTAK